MIYVTTTIIQNKDLNQIYYNKYTEQHEVNTHIKGC